MKKLKVKEVIAVEGRDDTTAVMRAIEGLTIETHGFGIRKETWSLLQKAYEEKGLIILTDPDFSGEEIRRKLTERFPGAAQAYLPKSKAEKKGDIGVENARPEDIIVAIEKAHYTKDTASREYTTEDLDEYGLTGRHDSAAARVILGEKLGIGYGNGKALLKKLNNFNIERSDFEKAVKEINDRRKSYETVFYSNN